MKKIIINICFILIALTAVASVCACDADNCTEEVDLSGNNVENIVINEITDEVSVDEITVNSTADEITVNSTADEEGANRTDVNGSNGGGVSYGPAVDWMPPINITPGGDIAFCFELDNINGCKWVVSECIGVKLLSEYISDFDGKLYSNYIVTQDDAIVKFDLINSNGEVIDTRVKSWGDFFGYNL